MRKPQGNERTEWWIKKQVSGILDATGWTHWMPSANAFGRNGISDFLCVKKPRLFLAIETKYDDMVTAQQFKFLADVHNAGHFAFLVDETNIGDLRGLLSRLSVDSYIPETSTFLRWKTQNPVVDIRISKP